MHEKTMREIIHRTILKWEGGYVNDAQDPGGETHHGISKRSYPNVNIRTLTLDDAIEIYIRDYWHPLRLSEFEYPSVAAKVFDMAVNLGQGTAARMLQQALGVASDGIIGPITLRAVNLNDPKRIIERLVEFQVMHYADLIAQRRSLAKYARGWMARALDRPEVA